MAIVLVLTLGGFFQGSNLWPILLMFTSPVALLYLCVRWLVRSRIHAGYGPRWINAELKTHGISAAVAQALTDAAEPDWLDLARGITAIRFRAFHSYDAQDFHEHKLAVRQQIEYLEAIRNAVGDEGRGRMGRSKHGSYCNRSRI